MDVNRLPSRFTVCGSRLLDERIKQELRYIVHFLLEHHRMVVARPVAIWLGGSYGRGEGAVFRHQNNEKPWFDYDIFLVYSQLGAEQKLHEAYRSWSLTLEERLGIPVQLRSPGDLVGLRTLEPRLMWYDLVHAHQALWGDSSLLPSLRVSTQPTTEMALRLLLYWGGRLLSMNAESRALQEQNGLSEWMDTWYRAASAIGDACLIGLQSYHVSCQERAQRYHSWQIAYGRKWVRELGYLYQEALQYRLLPSDFNRHGKQLLRRYDKLLELFVKAYLFILEKHLKRPTPLASLDNLFLKEASAYPSLKSQFRHVVDNFRFFRGQGFHSGWYSRSLVERLYFLLPYLLRHERKPSRDSLRWICPGLDPESTWQEMEAYFLNLWTQVAEALI